MAWLPLFVLISTFFFGVCEAGPTRRQGLSIPDIGNPFINTTQVQCPHLFSPNIRTRTCFLFVRIQATWPEALAYCEAYNAELAIIESQEEQIFLENYIKANMGSISGNKEFWLGGADIMSEGDWQWAVTLEKFTYTNWQSGNPDNSHGNEHCLELKEETGFKWNDQECDNHHYFVCETIES